MIAGVRPDRILICHLRLLTFKLTLCADEAGELFCAILEPSARAVSILPSHPEFNAHWIMIQLKPLSLSAARSQLRLRMERSPSRLIT